MSLLRPKYWTNEFFAAETRESSIGYPPHFQALRKGELCSAELERFSEKDVFELVGFCVEGRQRGVAGGSAVKEAAKVLARLNPLRESSLCLLLVSVLHDEARRVADNTARDPTSVASCILNTLLSKKNLATFIHMTFAVIFRVMTEAVPLQMLGVAGLSLLEMIAVDLEVSNVYSVFYALTVVLRVSQSVPFNYRVMLALRTFLPKAMRGTAIPCGIHIAKKCCEVGRVALLPQDPFSKRPRCVGGDDPWQVFLAGSFPGGGARVSLLSASSATLWGEMEATPLLTWGHREVKRYVFRSEQDFLANAGIAVHSVDTESTAPRFDEESVEEALNQLASALQGKRLVHAEVLPLLEALRHLNDCTSKLPRLLLRALAVCFIEPNNAELCSHLGVIEILVSLLKIIVHKKKTHVDPMCIERDMPITPLLSMLKGGEGLKEMVRPEVRGWEGVVACLCSVAEGLSRSRKGGVAVKGVVLGMHQMGVPALLLALPPSQLVYRTLQTICKLDPSSFVDYFKGNAHLATPLASFLTIHSDDTEVLTTLLRDPNARHHLPKYLYVT